MEKRKCYHKNFRDKMIEKGYYYELILWFVKTEKDNIYSPDGPVTQVPYALVEVCGNSTEKGFTKEIEASFIEFLD